MKEEALFGIFAILIIGSMFSIVSAEMLVSDAGVEYESKILDEFAKLEGTNETFVDLIIYIKDMSEVENLILTFSKDEIGRVINRNISNRIAIEMNEEAFFKLIQDEQVESVYYNAPIHAIDSEYKLPNFLIAGLMVLIALFIYLIIIKNRKTKNER